MRERPIAAGVASSCRHVLGMLRLRGPSGGRILGTLLLVVLSAAACAASAGHASRAWGQNVKLSATVAGNELVNNAGQPLRLIGVDRSGTEYACVQGWGIFDGPSDAASVAAISAWHTDAVRVPLNEDCWLGINGADASYSGNTYREAIESYVDALNSAGLIAVLDLHWSAPGTQLATGQQVMADADHSVAFWSSVASAFRSDPGVVFDLYNEPHDISWSCWLDGCTYDGWQVAGMQQMLDAVRGTGATQPVMAGGLGWAGDLSGWLANEPSDPLHQLVASVHVYNFGGCNTESCWAQTIAPVAAVVPVVTGELGENDCASSFIDSYMNWADRAGVSYLGWTWDTWDCSSGPALISSYDGTPTAFGAGFEAHLAQLAGSSPTPAPPSSTPPSSQPMPARSSCSKVLPSGQRTQALARTPDDGGYWIASSSGWVDPCGDATDFGELTTRLNAPVVGLSATPDGQGYWLVASDGGIFSFGDAHFYGSTGSMHLNAPVIGLSATPDGQGYWLVASDGGIFSFGDAHFYGSTGSMHLNAPVVGLSATPDGQGYWLVASDGGIFSFGDAHFYGSTGSMHLNAPVVGLSATPDGQGYWLVASDGGVFSFGDAHFYGSTGSMHLNAPVAAMESAPQGSGYRFLAADGGIFDFGTSNFFGSAA